MELILGSVSTIEFGPIYSGGTLYTTDNLVPTDFQVSPELSLSSVEHAGSGMFRITFPANILGTITITLDKAPLTSDPWLGNIVQPAWPVGVHRANLYLIVRRHGKDVTIVRRTVVSIDRITGEKIVTEQRWTCVAAFIPYRAMPRKDQVVTADAWFITDQLVQDKDEFYCLGDVYVAVGISQFDNYCVVAAKAVTQE